MLSLWPKIELKVVESPIKILQEQVDAFNTQLKGVLSCRLEREKYTMAYYDYIVGLYITSPVLTDYKMRLVEVKYNVAEAYPCLVRNCFEVRDSNNELTARDCKEFKDVLKSIFHSKEVISALQNIYTEGL